MSAIDQIVRLANAYLEAAPMEVTTLSWRVFRDTKKLPAIIESGADLHTRRHESAVRWFSENWPPEIEWPSDIARPSRGVAA